MVFDEENCKWYRAKSSLKSAWLAMGQYRVGLIVFLPIIVILVVLIIGYQGTDAATTEHRKLKLLPGDSCGVGVNHTEKNLVGYQAALDDAPWLALIRLKLGDGRAIFSCTGALINHNYVITAAHCIAGGHVPSDAYVDQVRLGEYNLDTTIDCIDEQCSLAPQDIEVEERILHPYYVPKNPEPHNDIGILRLKTKATINAYVKPICLPTTNINYEGKTLLFAGWSRIHTAGKPQTPEKKKVSLPVIPFRQCALHYLDEEMGFNLKEANQMCVGGDEGRNEYCHWGSGGPSMILEPVGSEMRWHIAGILSYGPPSCGQIESNNPDIHTKVGKYVNWILDNMRE